jgi:hypothetical protein
MSQENMSPLKVATFSVVVGTILAGLVTLAVNHHAHQVAAEDNAASELQRHHEQLVGKVAEFTTLVESMNDEVGRHQYEELDRDALTYKHRLLEKAYDEALGFNDERETHFASTLQDEVRAVDVMTTLYLDTCSSHLVIPDTDPHCHEQAEIYLEPALRMLSNGLNLRLSELQRPSNDGSRPED